MARIHCSSAKGVEMAANVLRYSIRDECLYGTIAKTSFSMKAFSGGGRGSTAGKERTDLKHWNTRKKAPDTYDEKNRGGSIPIGLYLASYFGVHPVLGACSQLTQTLSSLIQTDFESPIGFSVTPRDKFYIHGEGPKGSDGCIVPANKVDLRELLVAIKGVQGPVVLLVHSEGMNADKLEAARAAGNVA
jgi:hypothetical protein